MRQIRLTESQFRSLIAKTLTEEAENALNHIDWRALMDDAKNVYINYVKPIKAKHGIGWGRKDDGSEDYQRYSEAWNRYCDLVKQAQQSLLKGESGHGAIRTRDANLTAKVLQRIKKKTQFDTRGLLYKEKFLFDPILFLGDYKEMANDSPIYKYLYVYDLGGNSAYVKRSAIKVKATIPGKEREWDVSNYDTVDSRKEQHLGDANPNDSRSRAPMTRYVGQSTKELDGNILNRRVYSRTSNGNVVLPSDDDYDYKNVIEYFDDKFGEGDESLHGKPTDNRLYNFGESLMRRNNESRLYRLIKEAFEDSDNWRTDVLKGYKKSCQGDAPRRRANLNFVSPEMQQKYQELADKRDMEANELYKSASDKFNRRYRPVKYHNPDIEDWEFTPNRRWPFNTNSKGKFSKRIKMGNGGLKGYSTTPSEISGWEGVEDRLAIKDIDAFVNEKPYYDDDLGYWVDDHEPRYNKDKAKAFWKSHGFGESLMRRVTENVIRRLNEEQVPEFYDLEHYIASEILDLVDSGDNQGDLDIHVTFPYDNGDKVFGTVYFYFDNQNGSPNVSDIYPDLKIYYAEFNTYENYECDIQKLLDALKDEGVSASEYLRTR